mmetsp:Transcript_65814/g.174498  ORF Transcript_65814/g.174498 Transcript_65814/m.174498 type:complete len:84 (-) Transcript_65814:48-299(-)
MAVGAVRAASLHLRTIWEVCRRGAPAQFSQASLTPTSWGTVSASKPRVTETTCVRNYMGPAMTLDGRSFESGFAHPTDDRERR